ncbi:RNA dependent RNA polymerase-domain-containing protein [Microdochium trichocladiopsis]|uniref:RNA-dependent RNA polymerase n=1 Tax=Microdochium trichocladiopsis TaxID=1682393 RepID=A0A9P9BGP6_9PEZI|nr:RNA dependent RNA polymerase-domain-containing protein [Microdochium trichocladiopsis]KAH7016267.1 RNA dependent RNA polymerase-domain-containing protein [Microdochium trichocladiopsis]
MMPPPNKPQQSRHTATPNMPPKLSSMAFELKNSLSLDDREWRFQLDRLPSPQQLNASKLIKVIVLATEGAEQRMMLRFDTHQTTRATASHPLDSFLVLSLTGFRPSPGFAAESGGNRPITSREHKEYVLRLLRAGIVLQGTTYNFYGHSNSQLRSRACFLFAAPKDTISKMVESLGEFTSMKTVAKKAKRLGLLFSTAHAVLQVGGDRCEDIADIEANGYTFTDGCGLMAPQFAQNVSRRMRLKFRDRRYSPSVFQIRYRGYKGVVIEDPRMKNESTWLRLRQSMKKFNAAENLSFSVVDYSKPYAFGHLNDEVVMLLHALGVRRETLLRKQREYLDFLVEAASNARQAFRFLCYVSRHDLAEKVLLVSLESVKPQIQALIQAEYGKMLNKRDEQRCRILVSQSRLLFGVCDAWGILKEDECAVKVTMDGDGLPYALKNTEVLVARNPCLHPGDMQKFRVVDHASLSHLVDCIVFPTRGRRSPADMMSGGDLDGDKFLVCWDKDLIPSTISQPAEYPATKEPVRFRPITDDDRLVYFAEYTNASLGRVKNLYLDWARVKGPMAPECQELNRLFSQCVDGMQIKIPPRLESIPVIPSDNQKFILDELHEVAAADIARGRLRETNLACAEFDIIELLVSRQDIAITEFELLKLTAKWCRRHGMCLGDFLPYFDMNSLTAEEKHWVLSSTQQLQWAPSLILNALCTSKIVSENDIAHHQLGTPRLRWKRVYDSSQCRLATFLDTAAKTFEEFHRKLVVAQVDERLSLMIYIPRMIPKAQDCLVHDTVRVIAFPHAKDLSSFGRLSRSTRKNYRLYCDNNLFQLFEGQRSNTWIFIKRSASDDTAYRSTVNRGDRRRLRQATIEDGRNFDYRVSVALDKFSQGLQRQIGRVNGHGLLAAEQLGKVLKWLGQHNMTSVTQNIYGHVLSRVCTDDPDIECLSWQMDVLLDHLSMEPSMAASFSRLSTRKAHLPRGVLQKLQDRGQEILNAIVRCACSADALLVPAFESALSLTHALTLDGMTSLVELCALTIHSPDLALDILLGCLKRQSLRLLAGTIKPPLAMHFADNIVSIALDHIHEANEQQIDRAEMIMLHDLKKERDGYPLAECAFRIDSAKVPETWAHVRLTAASKPKNAPLAREVCIDALVVESRLGSATFQCFQPLPVFVEQCSWILTNYGPFAKSRALFAAMRHFADTGGQYCCVANELLASDTVACEASAMRPKSNGRTALTTHFQLSLNESQRTAMLAALTHPLVLIWGPPGTGKTQTIVAIILGLLDRFPEERILVTAPTHNAVDNLMRRYLDVTGRTGPVALRVSTEASLLHSHTLSLLV